MSERRPVTWRAYRVTRRASATTPRRVGCVNLVMAPWTGGFAEGTESRHARVGHALIKRGALALALDGIESERAEVR